MLSLDITPDSPSCSHKVDGLKSDGSDHPKCPAGEEVELLKQDHAFSIREYVLTSRSKDIQVNWPFSDKFLQLCLKHDVREVLPPFEPVAAVRRDLSVTIPGAELDSQEALVAELERNKGAERKDVILLGSEANSFGHKLDEPLVSRSLGSTDRIPSLVLEKDDTNKPVKEDRRSIKRSAVSLCQKESVVEETTALIVTTDAQTRVSSDFLSKNKPPAVPASKNIKLSKALLVVCDKTQSSCEQSEQKRRLILKFAGEGIVPDPSAAVTEPMASKTCPVCKTFSSTSNTTLNAHIDQCLAAETAVGIEVAGTSRVFKVKPRKMRSMVDICATAPRCTLEELERRNGMSCATAPTTDELPGGSGQAAQTKRPRPDFCDDGREVYVDSSGTKVRLLSRFNDVPTVVAGGGGAKPWKLGKLKKGIFPGKEQLGFRGHKAHKKRKLHKKKLGLYKHHGAETLKGSKSKEHEKEESLSELLKTRESVATTEVCRTLEKWASCKRSAPSKKFKDLMPPTIANENSRLSSGSYTREECHLQGNSSLQQDRYTSSHTDTGGSHDSAGDWVENSVDICQSNVHTPAKGCLKTSDHSMWNGAISSGTFISSRRCPRPETHGKSHRNPLTSMDRDILSFKSAYSRKSSRLMELKNSHVDNRNTPKKSRRLIVENGQGLQQLPNKWVEPLLSGCGDSRNDRRLRHLKNIMREEAKEGVREDYQIQNESDFSLDEELQSPGSTNHVSHDSYSEDAGDLNIDTRKAVSQNSPPDTDLKADSCGSVDEQTIPISANEGDVAPVSYSSCDEQEVRFSDVSTVVSSQTAEANLRYEGEYMLRIQQNKCGDFTEPELCLPSYEDIGYQVFHANSSATVGNPQTIPEYQFLKSHSLPPCSAATWQPAISTMPPAIQGKQSFIDRARLIGAVHGEENHTFFSGSTTVAGERTKLGRESLRVSIPPNYLLKFPDDQPCCCSRKESVSRTYHGSNISRKDFVSNLPVLKGNQMTSSLNNSNRMDAFTSFGAPSAPHVDPFMVESPMSRVKSASAFRNITSTEAFDVPSPSSLAHAQSAPSPVLRLMGKNLMVMNKDTDVPVQDHKAVLPNDNSNANYLKLLGFSAGSAFNYQPSTGRNLSSSPSNSCTGYSNISRNFGNPKYVQSCGLTHDFSAQRFSQPKVKADVLVQPKRVDRNYSSPAGLTYEMIEKPQCLRPAASDHITDSPREVIVIDDVPEVEVDRHGTCRLSGPKSYQPVLGGMLLHPSAANSNSGSIRFTSTQVPHVMSWRQC